MGALGALVTYVGINNKVKRELRYTGVTTTYVAIAVLRVYDCITSAQQELAAAASWRCLIMMLSMRNKCYTCAE